ncbi:unnamed protein product [Calicophoron daubneyi]|uniref:Protein farnesyltransferase subunit beta n=1 Tax=Calicophoron daubneyi TaxID=300641 RepID=A0AAV2TSJ9_CALDB
MERLTLFNLRQRSRAIEPQTTTIVDQIETEQLVRKAYYEKLSLWKNDALRLFKLNHINYLTHKLVNLPTNFEHLDASQPWLAYWMVHSLRLLNCIITDEIKEQLIQFVKSTQHPDGGFGGGPYQFAHLATTYGAVNCLVSLCRRDALEVIDRVSLANWLKNLHRPDGSFVMHIGGEADVRGAYCAAAVAKLTGILRKYPEMFESTAEWIASCQTYEGGFGAEPGVEAHGGYTFCAVAALCLLERPDLIDLPRLIRWISSRQMASEGGFQGRTNKLVDSCYSFWQGAVFPIIEELLTMASDPALSSHDTLFNTSALQEYILLCCQKVSYTRPGLSVPSTPTSENNKSSGDGTSSSDANYHMEGGGGLIDKPGKNADVYHTCYALSGLSMAQHSPRVRYRTVPLDRYVSFQNDVIHTSLPTIGQPNPAPAVDTLSEELDNELADLDPVHNLVHDGLSFALTYFSQIDEGASPAEAEQLALKASEECHAPSYVSLDSTEEQPMAVDHEYSKKAEERPMNTCTTP